MKYEIEIPDLPEGWEAVAYRIPKIGEYYLSKDNVIKIASNNHLNPSLIIIKKQPRLISFRRD